MEEKDKPIIARSRERRLPHLSDEIWCLVVKDAFPTGLDILIKVESPKESYAIPAPPNWKQPKAIPKAPSTRPWVFTCRGSMKRSLPVQLLRVNRLFLHEGTRLVYHNNFYFDCGWGLASLDLYHFSNIIGAQSRKAVRKISIDEFDVISDPGLLLSSLEEHLQLETLVVRGMCVKGGDLRQVKLAVLKPLLNSLSRGVLSELLIEAMVEERQDEDKEDIGVDGKVPKTSAACMLEKRLRQLALHCEVSLVARIPGWGVHLSIKKPKGVGDTATALKVG